MKNKKILAKCRRSFLWTNQMSSGQAGDSSQVYIWRWLCPGAIQWLCLLGEELVRTDADELFEVLRRNWILIYKSSQSRKRERNDGKKGSKKKDIKKLKER